MDERKSSFSFLSLSINARGATVPLSRLLLAMWTNSARRAEKSVGGEGGMGGPVTEVVPLLDPSAGERTSLVENFLTFRDRGFAGAAG